MVRGVSERDLALFKLVLEKRMLELEELLSMVADSSSSGKALVDELRKRLKVSDAIWAELLQEAERRIGQPSSDDTGETLLAVEPHTGLSETLYLPDSAIMQTGVDSDASTVLLAHTVRDDARQPALTVVVDESLTDTPGPASTVLAPAAEQPDDKLFQMFSGPRYTLGREIARGGHGKIHLARDERLGRHIALKLLIKGKNAAPNQLRKFILEARATGLLEHPNIVPVYDLGLTDDGEIYYTMKMVRGRSLKYIIYRLSKGDKRFAQEYTRFRLLNIFQQVCQAVHFAHSKGIIHRDLKPENIMIGDYGEVLVMDWGLAKIVDLDLTDEEPRGIDILPDDLEKTRIGTISGTPSYMPPEQARGRVDLIDFRSDVYSLGAILYEILTYHPPFEGTSVEEVLEQVRTKAPVPPRKRAPDLNIPADLEEICLKALEKDKEKRYQSARELYTEIERFLEGAKERERRRKQALDLVQQARLGMEEYFEARREITEASQRLEALLETGIEGISAEALWKEEKRLLMAQMQQDRILSALRSSLEQAISLAPELSEPREMLADLHYARFLEAEEAHNKKEMLYNRKQIRRLAPERYHELLAGFGTVRFTGHNGRGKFKVYRYERRGVSLVPVQERGKVGTISSVLELPIGNYLIDVNVEGRRLLFPILIERGEHVVLNLDVPEPVNPALGGLSLVVIPRSKFIKGGDSEALGYLKMSEPEVPSFAISRYPITVEQYFRFLHDFCADEREFRSRAPRLRPDSGVLWRPTDSLAHIKVKLGWEPEFPVVGISWDDANAFCEWLSDKTNAQFRLPTDEEWEKAARGADGRVFPWGNEFESAMCLMRDTPKIGGAPARVGSVNGDVSPYGVCDMAGLVREWCLDFMHQPSNERLVRGGSWFDTEIFCRAASRSGFPSHMVRPYLGFRVVQVLEDNAAH